MKIVFISNYAMGLWKFRKEIVQAFLEKNDEVHIIVPEDEFSENFKRMGCQVHPSKLERHGKNPFAELQLLRSYIKQIKAIQPDIVFSYTIKPNLYAGIATRLLRVPFVPNITGLGEVFQKQTMLTILVKNLYKFALKDAKTIFFQNSHNKSVFLKNRIVKEQQTTLIPGSGVNLSDFEFQEFPPDSQPINILYIGRLSAHKGIPELCEVAQNFDSDLVNFQIVGFPEDEFIQSFDKMLQIKCFEYFGKQEDVRSFIKQAHAVIQPSHHEGLSNTLLEAAAMGRPLLASNIPGCKEIIDQDQNGYLFEVNHAESLKGTIQKFIDQSFETRKLMGENSRHKVNREYDRNIIVQHYLNLRKRNEDVI